MMRRKGGGRPRKDGPRHPSGQLVQKVEPNPRWWRCGARYWARRATHASPMPSTP